MNDWDDLRYFLSVARSGTLSGAAADLGVNHSTVSRRINAYEKQHDVRLFERLPGGYEMTQAAENIYQYALEIEERTGKVERELFGRDTRLQGRLCITAYHGIADLLLPHLHRFRDAYPDIDLELFITTEVRDLAAREADIAVRGTPHPPEHLVGKKIADAEVGIYTSAKYQARGLQRHEVVLWRDELQLPEWVVKHFPDARVALRVDDVVAMRVAVREGLGMARLPCWVGDTAPNLLRMNVQLSPGSWGWWILVHADLRSTARVRAGRDFLIDVLSGYKGLLEGRHSTYL
ncbi:MAG: LysR family transcriptional regulator [Gammaproteobacteria bacterium]|nr:MAG: LysR family transcriptional regulator [Gammaproteobacteria bacterium]RLA52428.1 MAG: LysR family transcriptional regulator [Gammaproteobacteria bacterium]